jgi:hypothetical protein
MQHMKTTRQVICADSGLFGDVIYFGNFDISLLL